MEKTYQLRTECLWYADCCPEDRCNGRGKVREKVRRGSGDLVAISSKCQSYWPTESGYPVTQEQKLEETARIG